MISSRLRSLTETTSPDLELIRGDVDFLAVDEEMAVVDELAGLGPGGGETGAPDDVVEPLLEQAQQVLTGDATLAVGHLVVAAELALEDPVHGAQLLLLPQLEHVVALLDPAAAVLAGWIRTALDRAALVLAERSAGAATGAVAGPRVTSHD